jgi:hypothetical protein
MALITWKHKSQNGFFARDFIHNFSADENGSISVLIIGLAALALTLAFGVVDLSDAFLAKRELQQISEEATQRAAHEISLPDYYASNLNAAGTNAVPLDCSAALASIQRTISVSQLRNNAIEIDQASCDGSEVALSLKSTIKPIVDFPILRSTFGGIFEIRAVSSAASIVPKA